MEKITPEMIKLALMYLQSNGHHIKKIKVTSEFADYLVATCHPTYVQAVNESGIYAAFTGIPVVIDDTIENKYYELEF